MEPSGGRGRRHHRDEVEGSSMYLSTGGGFRFLGFLEEKRVRIKSRMPEGLNSDSPSIFLGLWGTR